MENAFVKLQDKDLDNQRDALRDNRNKIRIMALSGVNNLCGYTRENVINGIHKLYYCSNTYHYDIKPRLLNFTFRRLLSFLIYQIHIKDASLINELNMVLYILRFTNQVNVKNEGKAGSDPFKSDFLCQSLTQNDVMNFLFQEIQNPILSENCLKLLAMILRKKNSLCLSVICDDFIYFALNNPEAFTGEILHIYLKSYYTNFKNSQYIQPINKIIRQHLNCSNFTNIKFAIRSLQIFIQNHIFQDLIPTLIQNLPIFLKSQNSGLISSSLKIVFKMNEVPDDIVVSVFTCLPVKFKKFHNEAFQFISNNYQIILHRLDPNEIAIIIDQCLNASQYFVKKNALVLLHCFNNEVQIFPMINFETLVSFLDDKNLSIMALPFLISFYDIYENNQNLEEYVNILSDYIDVINHLIENENESASQMSKILLTKIESYL